MTLKSSCTPFKWIPTKFYSRRLRVISRTQDSDTEACESWIRYGILLLQLARAELNAWFIYQHLREPSQAHHFTPQEPESRAGRKKLIRKPARAESGTVFCSCSLRELGQAWYFTPAACKRWVWSMIFLLHIEKTEPNRCSQNLDSGSYAGMKVLKIYTGCQNK